MAQPPSYIPQTDFSQDEADNVGGRSTVRTAALDAELSALQATLSATLTNLALNQRDDGEIRDGRVKMFTLASDVLALLTTSGTQTRTYSAWTTATLYTAGINIVTQSGNTYICAVTHTSGTFATDLAAAKWILLALGTATAASAVTFAPTATLAATNVQTAIDEADTENRALSAAIVANLANSAVSFGSKLVAWMARLTGAVARWVEDKLAERISVADFGSGSAAVVAALQSGARRIYLPRGDFNLSSAVSATLPNDVEIYGEGRFLYTGANSTDNLFTIQSAGYSLKIYGVGFDGASAIAGGLRIENTAALSDTSPICVLERCSIANFKMNTASIWNNGAYIAGSFERVELRGNRVLNITRLAGTGVAGVSGTTGIYVTQYDAARYVRNCIHVGNSYTNILGGDLLASAANVDYDGFKFYAPSPLNNANVDTTVYSYMPATCESHGNSYRNCRGRAVKIQALSSVHNEKVIRDADYTILGGASEINLQYGAGTVRDIEFFYKDYAGPTSPIQSAGHSLIVFYEGSWYNETNGGLSVSGIRVYNNIKAGTGLNINQIVNAQVGAAVLTKDKALIRVSDVVVNRGDVDWILTVSGDTGADGLVVLEDISVAKLTYSAVGTQYANPGFKMIARGIFNLDGVNTPANAKRFISDVAVPGGDITWSGTIDGHGVHGFLNTYNRGADFTPAPMLVGGALTGTGQGGAASVQTVTLANDASSTFERRFFNSGRGLIVVSVNYDYTSQGVFAIGSNGVYLIAGHVSHVFSPSTTGANLDTASKLNLWFTGGALNVKNRLGASYAVTVAFVG